MQTLNNSITVSGKRTRTGRHKLVSGPGHGEPNPTWIPAGSGVIDPYHRVHGYNGLHIVDGSTISANLGVNSSLTITAQAERAMSYWPNNGDADPRPPQGDAYRRIDPVPPRNPAVPADAPAALR